MLPGISTPEPSTTILRFGVSSAGLASTSGSTTWASGRTPAAGGGRRKPSGSPSPTTAAAASRGGAACRRTCTRRRGIVVLAYEIVLPAPRAWPDFGVLAIDLRHAALVTSLWVDRIWEFLVEILACVVLPQRLAVLHTGFLYLLPEALTWEGWILESASVASMRERLAIFVSDVNASVEAKRYQSVCTS